MKLSVNKYKGYANTPEFKIDYGNPEFDAPVITPREGVCGGTWGAWFTAFTYDKCVMSYRMLCGTRVDGNVNFGYPEQGYPSGWSSRASVINKVFGYKYVDVSNYGIELDKLLYLIHEKYVGDVFMYKRENGTDVEYAVEPYFKDQHDHYCLDCDHLILHTIEPGFIEIALKHLTGDNNMYQQGV